MTDYVIDLATQAALPACLALLGPVVHPDCLVFAARTANGALAGAAGVLWQSWGRPPGFPAWVHVLPDCRRRGIGSALARELVRRAEGEAGGVWAARPLPEGEPAALFSRSAGFEPTGRQIFFEADAAKFLAAVERLVGVLKSGNRIPERARLVRLEESLVTPVADLLRSELASTPPGIARMLAASLGANPRTAPVDPLRSRLLLVDCELAGALLTRRLPDGRNSGIICNVVAPQFRRGWANALLLEATTRDGIADGGERFQFDCEDTNRDTIGLAERCNAQRLRTDALFRYALASAA